MMSLAVILFIAIAVLTIGGFTLDNRISELEEQLKKRGKKHE
jgi:hypothetical protein